VENRLEASGWGERAGAVVLDPELESWIWTTSPHVARVLGWAGRESEMREYLAGKGFFRGDEVKPLRPKEAVEAALYEVRIPKSPALYLDLGKHVSHARCTDAAFLKFKSTLKAWFPPP